MVLVILVLTSFCWCGSDYIFLSDLFFFALWFCSFLIRRHFSWFISVLILGQVNFWSLIFSLETLCKTMISADLLPIYYVSIYYYQIFFHKFFINLSQNKRWLEDAFHKNFFFKNLTYRFLRSFCSFYFAYLIKKKLWMVNKFSYLVGFTIVFFRKKITAITVSAGHRTPLLFSFFNVSTLLHLLSFRSFFRPTVGKR